MKNLSVLILAIVMVGCGGGSITPATSTATPTQPSLTLNEIVVTPSTATVVPGIPQKFSAQAYDKNNKPVSATFAWSTDANATVNSSGTSTTFQSDTVGGYTVTATAEGASGNASITVAESTALTSISVSPVTTSIYLGSTQLLNVVGFDGAGNVIPITAGSLQLVLPNGVNNVALVGQTNSSVTLQGNALTTNSITASLRVNAAVVSNSFSLTVIPAPSQISSIVISPLTVTIVQGATQTFTAAIFDQNGNPFTGAADFWTVTNGDATLVNTGIDGPVASVQGTNVGTTQVVVTSGSLSATATLTIVPKPTPPPSACTLASIVLSPPSLNLLFGATAVVNVQGFDLGNQPCSIPLGWSLSIVQGGSGVGSDAIIVRSYTANSATVQGVIADSDLYVVATSVATSGTVQSAPVSASVAAPPPPPPTLATIVLSPSAGSIKQGESKNFTASTLDQYGNPIAASLVWTVTNGESVNAGTVTAPVAGNAVVTATSGNIFGTASLTIVAPVLSSIAVSPMAASIAVGQGQQFSAQGFDQWGNSMAIPSLMWSASNGDAVVSNTGLAAGVSADKGVGIVASSGAIQSAAASLTVLPLVPTTLTVAPLSPLFVGGTQQASATVLDQFGKPMNVPVSWSSLNADATVSGSGLVTAVSAGSATITATTGGVSNSSSFTVTAYVLTTITVTSPLRLIYTGAYGSTVQMSAQGFDQFNNPMTVPFTWSSDNSAATVTGGLVQGVTVGTANISASSGAVSGSFNISVVQEPSILTTITVTPGSGWTYVDGKPVQFSAVAMDQFNNPLTVTFTWSSTAPATVDGTGLATGVSAGTANITATASLLTPELNKTFSVTSPASTLSVGSAPALAVIQLAPSSVTLAVAEPIGDLPNSTQMAATALDQYGNIMPETFIWTSYNPAVATVDSNGNVVGFFVGTAQIGVSALGVQAVPAIVNVTRAPAVLTTLTVNPPSPSVFPGGIVTLTPTALDQFNNPFPVAFTWLSDSSNATVDGQGNVTGVAAGTANVTVYAGSLSAPSAITIEQLQDVSGAWVFTFTVGGYSAQITATLQQSTGAITCAPYTKGGLTAFYWPPSNNIFYGSPSQYETCSGINFDDQVTLQFGDYLGNTTTLTGVISPAAPTILNGNITGSTPQNISFSGPFSGQHQ